MKNIFPVLVLLMLGYVGYVFWHNHHDTIAQAPPPPVAVPVDAATPAPVATATPPPARNLAPPGTYFLLQRVSIMTDSGVIGDQPGTKVTLVKAGPPMVVTDGQNQFSVDPAQVTNDLDIATRAFYADQTALARISAVSAQQAADYAKQQEADMRAFQAKQRALGAAYAEPMHMDTGELNQPAQPVTAPAGGNYRSLIH